MKCSLLTAFFTSVLLSCLVACYIAVCILRDCLSVCLCLSWAHAFSTKINGIYNWGFSGVSKETITMLDSRTSTSNIMNRRGKNLCQVVQKMSEKNKNNNKKNRCCKALCINM